MIIIRNSKKPSETTQIACRDLQRSTGMIILRNKGTRDNGEITKQSMKRVVQRKLPNGQVRTVYPFHVSVEGLETMVLYRDEEDYGVMVKKIAICARRKNVIVVIYAVVSNHCHVAILACTQSEADSFANEIKRDYSQWFHMKYGVDGVLRRNDSQALLIETDWHLRNALAYIPRNALDNGVSVSEYRWSGFRAMFSREKETGRYVRSLTKREKRAIMHSSSDPLNDVLWMIDTKGELIPHSFCDTAYLEQAFNGDPAYFLKTIGSLDSAEAKESFIDGPRRMLLDNDLLNYANDTSLRWFSSGLLSLPLEKKYRLMTYVARTRKTTVPQLSRVFGVDRESVSKALMWARSVITPQTRPAQSAPNITLPNNPWASSVA